MSTWFIYLIETAAGQLYTGITTDVRRRFKEHEEGKGAKYLRGKGPLKLKCHYAAGDRSIASRLEARVKSLTPSEKRQLIHDPDRFGNIINTLESISSDN